AGRALDLLDEVQLARDLVAGDPGPAVRLDVLERRRRPRPRLDDRADARAPPLVRHADDDDVVYVGVGLHRTLDLLGEDLLPARVDGHRPATEQRDRPVRLDRREVTRDRVARPVGCGHERRRALLGILVVLDRDVALARELADLPGARLDRFRSSSSTTVSRIAVTVGP